MAGVTSAAMQGATASGDTGGDAVGASSGGVDVLDAAYSPAGAKLWAHQFGTAATGGVDNLGEANPSMTALSKKLWLTGVTYGSSSATRSHGVADIFAVTIAAP